MSIMDSISNSVFTILSNSDLSMPAERANLNKLLRSVLMCCLMPTSALEKLSAFLSRRVTELTEDELEDDGLGCTMSSFTAPLC